MRVSRMLTPGTLIFASMPMKDILPALLVKRDISDAIRLHRTWVAYYLRREMTGFVPGSFIAGRSLGEFRTRGGSTPLVRFY